MPIIAPSLDHSWRKDAVLSVGKGYGVRSGKPSSIVIHTTNNAKKNTAFRGEAEWLQRSAAVSAHYLVGKRGEIAQILHPDLEAWHAGGRQPNGTWTAIAAFDNEHSIGIEAHVSVGETWTDIQRSSLTWLVRWLMSLYQIPPEMVETHRKIAMPIGRKTDPEGWSDRDFYQWRNNLVPPPVSLPPTLKKYRVRGTPVFQQEDCTGPVALYLNPGTIVDVDKTYAGERAHLSSGAGFIRLDESVLEVTQ